MSIPTSQPSHATFAQQASPPRLIRLGVKLAISFMGVTLLVALVLTTLIYIRVRDNLRRSTEQYMVELVSLAGLQVNADANAALIDPGQEGSEQYVQIKRILQQIRASSPNIRYVYTMRYSNNQEIFIVDAETNPELISHLGDVYEDALPSSLYMMSIANEPYVESEFSSDRWGTWLTGCAPLFRSNGARGDFLCMDMSASDLIAQTRQVIWVALITLAFLLPLAAGLGWFMGQRLSSPLAEITTGIQNITGGNFQYQVKASSRDEMSLLPNEINRMTASLVEKIAGLQHTVVEQAAEIERRSSFLAAAADLNRAALANLDLKTLSQQIIELIQDQFGLDYVGLFLLSDDGKWAELRAGTGEAGRVMVARQHRIAINEGMIGWCITNAQERVAQDINLDLVRLETPELPDTRSEAALPLSSAGHTFGALSVQSKQERAFDATEIESLRIISNLAADALGHALTTSSISREASSSQAAAVEKSQAEWIKIYAGKTRLGYYADMENMTPLDEKSPGLELARMDAPNVLHLPIRIRGQVLGTIHARKLETEGAWNPEESALLATLTDQLSLALDNARLYQDTQRSAEREHIVSEITAKVRASTNVNVILQTAVRELAEALRVSKATVQLYDESSNSDPADGSGKNHPVTTIQRSNGGDSNA
jgi:GAF domain-containing protein/HAMP domain-containing protein